MYQLESITYVNAASIPFAKVKVDGNTLMVGANGAGKTTVLRSVLYFYGVHEDSALGINIRKKRGFREYYFQESNAFIAYRYTNGYGHILVIAYRSANSGVKFKFVVEQEPIDDKVLFFEDQIARSPDEVWRHLRQMGYEMSETVSTLSEYRDILYGKAGPGWRKYAFFDMKEEHSNFVQVLSNIFINSKLDASSIQKTISNAIPIVDSIDLDQINRTIESFNGRYEDVVKFDENKEVIDAILRALVAYRTIEQEKQAYIDQFLSNQKAFEQKKEQLEKEIANKRASLDDFQKRFAQKKGALESQRNQLRDQTNLLKSDVKKAEKLLKEYQAQDIEKKLELYHAKRDLEREKVHLQKLYDELTDAQRSLKEKFQALREEERANFTAQLQADSDALRKIKDELQTAIEEIDATYEREREAYEKKKQEELLKLEAEAKQADETEKQAYKAYIEMKNRTFFKEELESASKEVAQAKAAYEQAQKAIEKYRAELQQVIKSIEAIEREEALALENLSIRYEHALKAPQEELNRLHSLLSVDDETLLSFIRKVDHPHEATLTTILKEEVLLNTQLNPRLSEITDSIYGIRIDSEELEKSNYSRASIESAIEEVTSQISSIKKRFEEEKSEIEKSFRNRLKEERSRQRQIDEALRVEEIALPKLKNESLKADDNYLELQKRAEQTKEEAVKKQKEALEQASMACQTLKDRVTACKGEIESTLKQLLEKKREKIAELKRKRKSEEQKFQAKEESLRQAYKKRLEEIEKQEYEALQKDGVDVALVENYKRQIDGIDKKLQEIEKISELVQRYIVHKKDHFDQLEEKRLRLHRYQMELDEKSRALQTMQVEYEAQHKELYRSIQASETAYQAICNDLKEVDDPILTELLQKHQKRSVKPTDERLHDLIKHIHAHENQAQKMIDTIRTQQDLLYRDIGASNTLDLSVRYGSDRESVLHAADELKNFVDDGKIDQFKEEISNLFALTINQLSKQTEDLLEARDEVNRVVDKIKLMLRDLEGISVIDMIDLRVQHSPNKILQKLEQLQTVSEEYDFTGRNNLFNHDRSKLDGHYRAIQLIKELRHELDRSGKSELRLDDTYTLEIRAIENGNDTGWQVSLDEVGSNGTDVMIKTIVNVSLLATALGLRHSHNEEDATYFHCILDEIGVLHPTYLKELIAFANAKRIRFLNGAPNQQLVSRFKRIYLLTNKRNKTMIRPLLSQRI
ncbi:MAG: hypothetical protein DSY46_07575 [Hydrogenimonas sp.]|nr:MAG: hypothetical protein DSY46_07575 [Hydrogenimonas sp.]